MATTDRDWADKRWLKAPREEVPFPVRLMDIGVALLVALVVLIAIVCILALTAQPTQASSRDGADWKVFLPLYFRNRDPISPPRCPRENARGEQLVYGIASQADGNEWFIDCRYAPAAVRS